MKTPLRLIFPVALFATLAACGNKGPLVRPPSPADEMAVPATTTAPTDATAPAPASTAPATPADTTMPAPASTAPAAPAETPPPANGGG